jgi:hypothetical protein
MMVIYYGGGVPVYGWALLVYGMAPEPSASVWLVPGTLNE